MRLKLTYILLLISTLSYGQFGVLVGNFDNIPRDGLVAEWLFSGNYLDTQGSNDATNNGTSFTNDRFGNSNSAPLFVSGDSNYISTPYTMSFKGTLSMSMWAYRAHIDSLIYVTSGNSPKYQFSLSDFNGGTLVGSADLSEGNVQVTSLDTGWVHVVYVFAGGAATSADRNKLYINGSLQSNNTSSTATAIANSAGDLEIGRRTDVGIYSAGIIDDVRVYEIPLIQSDIDDLYNEGGWPNP